MTRVHGAVCTHGRTRRHSHTRTDVVQGRVTPTSPRDGARGETSGVFLSPARLRPEGRSPRPGPEGGEGVGEGLVAKNRCRDGGPDKTLDFEK